ncbi:hypothetical protein IV203_031769 [Nitzschia inconspicua]|uniref:Uncharacterized protein n=1 Tax=Nitzschia inconspicua TaxID=303405 RepID=A0A9K3Q2X6_9STRA|nr:hypothetical protein IV203_031769 [Nitzschia inconspicua]
MTSVIAPIPEVFQNDKVSSFKSSEAKSSSNVFEDHQDVQETATTNGAEFLPCRARGMPMDHNIHTAYFEIHKDTLHGGDLVCSYPACHNTGVRFLYCKYCNDAISRRGFKIKHAHDNCGFSGEEPGSCKGEAPIISLSHVKRRREEVKYTMTKEAFVPLDDSRTSASSSNFLKGEREGNAPQSMDWGTKEQPEKGSSRKVLRMKELKREWTRLLEESQGHTDSFEAKRKRTKWLQRVETVYD